MGCVLSGGKDGIGMCSILLFTLPLPLPLLPSLFYYINYYGPIDICLLLSAIFQQQQHRHKRKKELRKEKWNRDKERRTERGRVSYFFFFFCWPLAMEINNRLHC